MAGINPIILESIRKYIDENQDIPNDIFLLIKNLLEIETAGNVIDEGILKLYNGSFDACIKESDIVEWSKKYVE